MSQHPNELSLLNLAKGLAVSDEIRRHVDGCSLCHEHLEQLASQESLFLKFNDPAGKAEEMVGEYANRRPIPRLLSRLVPAVATLGVAAALCLVIMQPQESSTVRLKGESSVRVIAARGNETFDVVDGISIQKGDLLKVEVISPDAGFMTVFAHDSGRFEPVSGLTNIPIEAKTTFTMSGSLEVECDGSSEELAVFVDEQFMKEVGEDGLPTGGHLFRLGMVCDDHQ